MTRLKTLLQLDDLHATFLKMNASGTIFVAALNGSALAIGAEFAWACDLRIMADGDFVIGLSEVLLALTPGGGGSQRLTRLMADRQKQVLGLLEQAMGKAAYGVQIRTKGKTWKPMRIRWRRN
jgi:enoyl-CoA hydratase/carnithine racemase